VTWGMQSPGPQQEEAVAARGHWCRCSKQRHIERGWAGDSGQSALHAFCRRVTHNTDGSGHSTTHPFTHPPTEKGGAGISSLLGMLVIQNMNSRPTGDSVVMKDWLGPMCPSRSSYDL
jgi:hypothetical protein